MPRWNNSLENNCKDILDNAIKNIRADLYQQLLFEVLESNIENNKKSSSTMEIFGMLILIYTRLIL
jgi:hypothetical protein